MLYMNYIMVKESLVCLEQHLSRMWHGSLGIVLSSPFRPPLNIWVTRIPDLVRDQEYPRTILIPGKACLSATRFVWRLCQCLAKGWLSNPELQMCRLFSPRAFLATWFVVFPKSSASTLGTLEIRQILVLVAAHRPWARHASCHPVHSRNLHSRMSIIHTRN